MERLLIAPPVAFVVVLLVTGGFAYALSHLSYRSKNQPGGAKKPYSCGEEAPHQMIQPNYSQFFHYAFFFTILHVVALFITTVPTETVVTFLIAAVYILGAVIGLFILLEK
jgi:NADH:ubiquinone oxidoreductase subunit 3 (subunit A)